MVKKRPVQQSRAKRTREDLLEAARVVFADQGYPRSTVDDITREAGVSKGAYYFHFDSKEDVLVAVVEHWATEVSTNAEELAKRGGLERSGLRPVIDSLLSVGGTTLRPRLVLEFLSQAEKNERVREALVSAQDAWRTATAKVISKARRAGLADEGLSADATAGTLLAIRDGLMVQACLPGSGRDIALRSATKAVLAILQPERLRRAG